MVKLPTAAARLILIAFTLLGYITVPTFAGDLGGSPEEFGKLFNKTALSAGLKIRVAKSKCRTEDRIVCAFSSGDGVVILAATEKRATSIQRAHLYLDAAATTDKTSAAIEYITALGVLMMIYTPNADSTERGIIVKSLARAGQSAGSVEEFLHGTRFEARIFEDKGLWVTIDRP